MALRDRLSINLNRRPPFPLPLPTITLLTPRLLTLLLSRTILCNLRTLQCPHRLLLILSPPPGPSFQHARPGAPASSAPYAMPPPGSTGPQNGWNDPPALSRTSKKKVLENRLPPPPITAPIMNPVADPQLQQAPLPASPAASAPYQPSHMPIPQPVHLDSSKPSTEGAPGAPIGNTIQAIHNLPAEKITKNPIPEEHQILKTTFEALIQRCLSSAIDPQTKRKLDDANKRLESLYDKLREQTLSPAIIAGLHNIARSIESRNYMEGLNIHTHIVSTSNFSETSAFMPVLKVVLTQANKLGV
ncbi:unnamed protein product [Ranitomeya imitator]|uniref:Uncharacterized protein n=1 Tax=Ranitomeya imitator TaxID=111125 RepID=A0ABN9M3Z7_9NEOB|nr:unnamed protein product [Ranitomeya imitator]